MRRVMVPVLWVLLVMSLSYAGYFGSRHLEGGLLQSWMACFFGTTYFLSIAFGTLYVYIAARLRGANLPQCILASLVNPSIWMTKEVLRLTESHPFLESLYWFLNPLDLWLLSFVIMEMGLATLMVRTILKQKGEEVIVFTMGPVVTVLGSLTFAVSIYAWGEGENIYVYFLEGYRLLFGYGL
ncbi:MAG: hypothetical protein ABFS43_00835 [Thermodesulfobacteriota bacterium]